MEESTLKRPIVFINAAMSVDGKISSRERSLLRISDQGDRERVDRLRAEVDAIVIGGKTLLNDNPKLTIRSDALRRDRVRRGLGSDPVKVVVSGSGNIPLDSSFFREGEGDKFVFTTERVGRRKVDELSRVARVFVVGKERVDFDRMLDLLAREGLHRVMVEGGSTLNFEMINAGVIDEIHVTISPYIIGGKAAPTLVDGTGFTGDRIKDLTLISCERIGESVLVKYSVRYNREHPLAEPTGKESRYEKQGESPLAPRVHESGR